VRGGESHTEVQGHRGRNGVGAGGTTKDTNYTKRAGEGSRGLGWVDADGARRRLISNDRAAMINEGAKGREARGQGTEDREQGTGRGFGVSVLACDSRLLMPDCQSPVQGRISSLMWLERRAVKVRADVQVRSWLPGVFRRPQERRSIDRKVNAAPSIGV